jgi:hypothetical protein
MATEFFVVMQKRRDGKIYADMHKAIYDKMYLIEEDADAAILELKDLAPHFQKVKIIGMLEDEWEALKNNNQETSDLRWRD